MVETYEEFLLLLPLLKTEIQGCILQVQSLMLWMIKIVIRRLLVPFSIVLVTMSACGPGQSDTQHNEAHSRHSGNQAVSPGHFEDITVEKFNRMRAEGQAFTLIDVRTPEEIANGVIDQPLQIEFRGDDYEAKLDALDKDQAYVVYCAGGGRSEKTAEFMAQKGFKNVFNLKGGYDEWIDTQK